MERSSLKWTNLAEQFQMLETAGEELCRKPQVKLKEASRSYPELKEFWHLMSSVCHTTRSSQLQIPFEGFFMQKDSLLAMTEIKHLGHKIELSKSSCWHHEWKRVKRNSNFSFQARQQWCWWLRPSVLFFSQDLLPLLTLFTLNKQSCQTQCLWCWYMSTTASTSSYFVSLPITLERN